MIKPRYIRTVLKEEHKALISTKDEPNHQRHLFEEEIQDLHFFQK